MANRERGEVDLVVGEKVYTLFSSCNAICELQTRSTQIFGQKLTYGQVIDQIPKLDFIALREVVWMLLKKNHKKEFPTAESVGDLIDDAGGLNAIRKALTEMFEVNAPDEKKDKGAGTEARPLDAQVGTGANSTSMAAALA